MRKNWVRDQAGLGEGLHFGRGKWGEVRRKDQHGTQPFPSSSPLSYPIPLYHLLRKNENELVR